MLHYMRQFKEKVARLAMFLFLRWPELHAVQTMSRIDIMLM